MWSNRREEGTGRPSTSRSVEKSQHTVEMVMTVLKHYLNSPKCGGNFFFETDEAFCF